MIGRPNTARPAITEVLASGGQMTIADMIDVLSLSYTTIDYNVKELIKSGEIHIAAWIRPPGRIGDPSAVYQSGPGENAPRPAPMTADQRRTAHRIRARERSRRATR